MEISPRQKKVNILWARGLNPIHLFGDFYLVRYKSTKLSKIPFYLIKKITDETS